MLSSSLVPYETVAPRPAWRHHRVDVGAEGADGVGFVERQQRVVARPLLVLLAADDAAPGDGERVGADVR